MGSMLALALVTLSQAAAQPTPAFDVLSLLTATPDQMVAAIKAPCTKTYAGSKFGPWTLEEAMGWTVESFSKAYNAELGQVSSSDLHRALWFGPVNAHIKDLGDPRILTSPQVSAKGGIIGSVFATYREGKLTRLQFGVQGPGARTANLLRIAGLAGDKAWIRRSDLPTSSIDTDIRVPDPRAKGWSPSLDEYVYYNQEMISVSTLFFSREGATREPRPERTLVLRTDEKGRPQMVSASVAMDQPNIEQVLREVGLEPGSYTLEPRKSWPEDTASRVKATNPTLARASILVEPLPQSVILQVFLAPSRP